MPFSKRVWVSEEEQRALAKLHCPDLLLRLNLLEKGRLKAVEEAWVLEARRTIMLEILEEDWERLDEFFGRG